MKSRYLLLTFVFLLALSLTACTCSHEWTVADCVNPQVCTKCSEVGAPATGHSWSAATCVAPQTCSHCAAVQGESLEHSYGTWTFTDELMSHTCTVCNHLEEEPLDHVLFLESLLTGTWDLYEIHYKTDSILSQIDNPYEPDGGLSILEIFSFNPEYYGKMMFSDGRSLQFTYGGRCPPRKETM